ncbi:MAG: ABC transporter substrate-binding protein [Saezia sp.]
MMRYRYILACAKRFFLFLLLFSTVTAFAQTKVSLVLARNIITPAEEVFAFAVPKQLGYFKSEGIEPVILKANGSTAAIQLVASGHAQIGFASSSSLAAAIEKGIPVKAFAGLTIRWPYDTAVLEGSNIQQVSDLKGKRIGVISLASASYADLKANLHYAKMTEQDVKIIPVGAGVQAAIALQNNHVDAIVSYSDSFTLMRQKGMSLRLLPRAKEMEELFSVTMFTSQEMLKNQPDLLVSFARSAYKGIIYTHLYPDEALLLAFKEFPELSGSKEPQGQEAMATKEIMLVALGDSIPKLADQAHPALWGQWLNISHERWQALLNFSHQTGLTDTQMKPEQIWDGSLIKKIYNFDPAQISK